MNKKPILFDDHTDTSKIEIQYILDTRVGKKTCMAVCEFCFLNKPNIANHVETPEQAIANIKKLKKQGYKVVPIVSDSFAEDGVYLKSNMFDNNSDWYMGSAAWSSGRPLLKDNHQEMLSLCVKNKIDTIVMTSHGTEAKERPFKGLTQPHIVEQAVENIRKFESTNDWKFKIVLTFTLSQVNRSKEKIEHYFDYCSRLNVDVIRFNQFADVQGKYHGHRLSKSDIEETYRTMKEVHDNHPGDVQMSVSEDFGYWGVEVMNFPKEVGHCVAGEKMFGLVYPNVYVCPVDLTLKAGVMREDGVIEWDQTMLNKMKEVKKHDEFGGCIGVAYPHSTNIQNILDEPEQVKYKPEIEIQEVTL